MTVRNLEAERLPSSISPEQFAQAMAALDLRAIAPERRKAALMDHLMRIQAATIHDRETAAVIDATRRLRRNLALSPTPVLRRPKKFIID